MNKISVQKINDSVYEELLTNIKNGSWKSGDKLPSESELCSALGVSRVSIRSALQRLKGMGLIEVKQGKGAYVCGAEAAFDFSNFVKTLTLTEKEMREINEVRKMIENKAIEILVSMNTNCDFSSVTEEFELLKDATERCDYEEFTKHDHFFHIMLVVATGNKYLIQVVRVLQGDFFIFLRESNKFLLRDEDDAERTREYFKYAFEIHEKIYNALITGDGEAALSLSQSHEELNGQRFDWYFSKV